MSGVTLTIPGRYVKCNCITRDGMAQWLLDVAGGLYTLEPDSFDTDPSRWIIEITEDLDGTAKTNLINNLIAAFEPPITVVDR